MRNYKRKPENRPYQSYSSSALDKAVQKVRVDQMSILKASKKYHVPYGTLWNKIHGLHGLKPGGQLRLSAEAEASLVKTIQHLTQWKVPLDAIDICCLVKSYLDKQGIVDRRFKNNYPSKDWLKSFVSRHSLTFRRADNVKPARAEVDADMVNNFFDELEETIAGVPAANVYNYDETNVSDDPGAKIVVTHRGLKRVERKIQHSKTCISLMYCGNAAGQFLPPMVVYKAQNCYNEWTIGGPKGTLYDNTLSGWFDSRCFECWFNELFLPHVSDKPGLKVIIGDNLASHFTPQVVESSVANNIAFTCLIPNSTHILQPLDVAVFGPMKREWRKILQQWRKESRVKGSIPKNHFPKLLNQLQNQLKEENIVSGFRATGIFPLDRQQALKRMPSQNRDIGGETVVSAFNESVAEILQQHCSNQKTPSRTRGHKVTPGKRMTPSDLRNTGTKGTGTTSQMDSHTTAGKTSGSIVDTGTRSSDQLDAESDDSSCTDVEPVDNNNNEVLSNTKLSTGKRGQKRKLRPASVPVPHDSSDTNTDDDTPLSKLSVAAHDSSSMDTPASFQFGQWVIAKYAGKKSVTYFAGQITEVDNDEDELTVNFVKRQAGSRSLFIFSETADTDTLGFDDIVLVLPEPTVNNRQQFCISHKLLL